MDRPSRLLNLNKSSTSNKKITAANATRSPFLSLPPELLARIYGYIFHVGVIQIKPCDQSKDGGYSVLLNCYSDMHEIEEPRFILHPNSDDEDQDSVQPDRTSTRFIPVDTRKPFHQNLRLDILRTCRQVYHEAVLIPFSVNDFHYIVRFDTQSKLQLLSEAMVPAQIKAIKHLRLVCIDAGFPIRAVMQKFKGLEHLVVRMVSLDHPSKILLTSCFSNLRIWNHLNRFSGRSGIQALAELPLKSLRITTEVESTTYLRSRNPAISVFDAWHRRLERKLLNLTAD